MQPTPRRFQSPTVALALLLALVADSAAAQTDARLTALTGIWAGDQGVMWDTSVAPGKPANAPFTPTYAAMYQRSLEAASRGKPQADQTTQCLPPGVPRIVAAPFPFEIVATPQIIYLLHEYMSQVRRIYMDANAPAPMGEPSYNGYSTGRWEGDTLVVETIDLRADSVLDTTHVPHSDALRVVERLRVLGNDKLEAQITLHDAKAYSAPWTVRRTYTRKRGDQILEYVCQENNRNPVKADGTTDFIVPK